VISIVLFCLAGAVAAAMLTGILVDGCADALSRRRGRRKAATALHCARLCTDDEHSWREELHVLHSYLPGPIVCSRCRWCGRWKAELVEYDWAQECLDEIDDLPTYGDA
jgi:uncharacterized protein YceK